MRKSFFIGTNFKNINKSLYQYVSGKVVVTLWHLFFASEFNTSLKILQIISFQVLPCLLLDMVKQEVVFKQSGQIIKVAGLSFFKLDHPTGGISCSPVAEVVRGRRWAAPGQEQDGMLAIFGSVCLSVCTGHGRSPGRLAGKGRDPEQDVVSVKAPLQLPATLRSSARRVVIVRQPEVVSYVSLSSSTSKLNGFCLL